MPLVRAVLETGTAKENLAYKDMKILQALDGAVAEVRGYTRYAIEGIQNGARIRVVAQGGVSKGIPSRTTDNAALRGTKNTVAMERVVLVAVGRSDGRPIILVPLTSKDVTVGIALLHVRFKEKLDASTVRTVLTGYRNRYQLIRDAVAETNSEFREEDLANLDVLALLTQPVVILADRLTAKR